MTRTYMLLIVLGGTLIHAQDTNTPFQHVIVLIQENRTPDNLFGSDAFNKRRRLPDADLARQGRCHENTITLGKHGAIDACFGPSHSHSAWKSAYDAGAMDRFCDNPVIHPGCVPPPHPQYQYVDNTPDKTGHGIVDPYFHIAENYGFANYMFQTNQGDSFPAHQFLFSGTSAPVAYPDQYYDWLAMQNPNPENNPAGCVARAGTYVLEFEPNGNISQGYNNGFPCYDHNTLADLLDNNVVNGHPQPISWRHYAPRITNTIWTAPNAIKHICVPNKPTGGVCTGPIWKSHVVADSVQILTDLGANPNQKRCDLQPVSWVVPDGNWSDHPGDKGQDGGPSWIAAVVNAVGGYDNLGHKLPMQCYYWRNTVVLITWDDWGGWYDHVLPYRCSSSGRCSGYPNGTAWMYVYGFRVPLLVVSAYTPRGYVSGSPSQGGEVKPYIHDFGSILNFIEYVFGQNRQSLGTIGDPSYPYADYFAPDNYTSVCTQSKCPYALSDFFNFDKPRAFQKITGAKYNDDYFLQPERHFSHYPMDPDNDGIDEESTD